MAAKNHNRRAKKLGIFGVLEQDIVLKLLNDQCGGCPYCGRNLNETDWELDHIKPLFLGGDNTYENCQLTCPTCNNSKLNRSPEVFSFEVGFLDSLAHLNYSNPTQKNQLK